MGITGCMAKIHKDNLFNKIPGLDIICAPSNIHKIAEDLKKIIKNQQKISNIKESSDFINSKYVYHDTRDSKISTWVSIIEGCENYCSYCIVPFARGREISRPAKSIIDEINKLVDKGFEEITLLGQNVNSYSMTCSKTKSGGRDFIYLLEKINNNTAIKRIRFLTSHPKDTSVNLFKAMKDLDKVCPHLHLPLQSGSEKILKLMNRKYTFSKYKKLVEKLRDIYPECSLTTDIITGFPSETQKDFQDTYNAICNIKYDSAYIFKYSARPGTAAAKMTDTVTEKEKKERNNILLELQNKICLDKNKKYINKTVDVYIEKKTNKKIYLDCDKKYSFKYTGRTAGNHLVFVLTDKKPLQTKVKVKVLDATSHALLSITLPD